MIDSSPFRYLGVAPHATQGLNLSLFMMQSEQNKAPQNSSCLGSVTSLRQMKHLSMKYKSSTEGLSLDAAFGSSLINKQTSDNNSQ